MRSQCCLGWWCSGLPLEENAHPVGAAHHVAVEGFPFVFADTDDGVRQMGLVERDESGNALPFDEGVAEIERHRRNPPIILVSLASG